MKRLRVLGCLLVSVPVLAQNAGEMSRVPVAGGQLEYEVRGHGEPVLLIHGSIVAAAFRPLMSEPALQGYQLIRYHRRGLANSSAPAGPFRIEDQAADALAVLQHVGIEKAHIVGHSYGGVVALQLALDAPTVVKSLVLLEPAIPAGGGPPPEHILRALSLYQNGDKAGAIDAISRGAFGPEWRELLSRTIPGAIEDAVDDADTTFRIENPAIVQWRFGQQEANRIQQPVVFMLGTLSGPREAERLGVLQSWIPHLQSQVIEGANHSLWLQQPTVVARGIAAFLAENPI